MRLGLFRDLAIEEWEQCGSFLEKMDSLLAEEDHGWQSIMDEEVRIAEEDPNVDGDYLAGFDEIRNEHTRELHEFRTILNNSVFVHSYSIFEHKMVRMCESLKTKHNFSSSIMDKDCRPNIWRVNKYIKQHYGSKLLDVLDWRAVRKYSEIRNRIVHDEAFVSSNWDLKAYAEKSGILTNGRNSRIEITRPYCEEAIKVFRHFMAEVLDAKPITTSSQSNP